MPVVATSVVVVAAGTSTPQNSLLTELAFGPYGTNNSQVTTHAVDFNGGTNFSGGTISFSNGAGVFRGNATGAEAPAPNGTNTSANEIQTDYLAAVAGSSVTLNFNSTQAFFGLLWGSASSGNTLTFYNGTTSVYTLTYSELVASYGAVDQGDYYVGVNIPGGYTSVVASSTSGGFEFGDITYSTSNVSDPFTGSGVQTTTPYDSTNHTYLCFLEGTMIAVPGGAMAVERLEPGMMVTTASGRAQPVRWVGMRRVSTRFADPLRANPICITAGALEDGIPSRDLLLSPDHAVLVDGLLIQAAALVNGSTVYRVSDMPEQFTYYHVELANHELIMAEAVPAETFVDNASRAHFDNWDTHPDHGAVTEMDLPRAKSARQVPQATAARLLSRQAKVA